MDASYMILRPTSQVQRPLRVPQVTLRLPKPSWVAPMEVGNSSSSHEAPKIPDVIDADLVSGEEEFGHHKAKGLRIPTTPSETERRDHKLTHVPFRAWCPHCVAGKAKDPAHCSLARSHDGLPKAFLDCYYVGDEVDEELATCLGMTDQQSNAKSACMVEEKGPSEYPVNAMIRALFEWRDGRTKLSSLTPHGLRLKDQSDERFY